MEIIAFYRGEEPPPRSKIPTAANWSSCKLALAARPSTSETVHLDELKELTGERMLDYRRGFAGAAAPVTAGGETAPNPSMKRSITSPGRAGLADVTGLVSGWVATAHCDTGKRPLAAVQGASTNFGSKAVIQDHSRGSLEKQD